MLHAALRQAYKIYPARMMPSTVIAMLGDAGFTIISEADLDAELALYFQAGEESARNQ